MQDESVRWPCWQLQAVLPASFPVPEIFILCMHSLLHIFLILCTCIYSLLLLNCSLASSSLIRAFEVEVLLELADTPTLDRKVLDREELCSLITCSTICRSDLTGSCSMCGPIFMLTIFTCSRIKTLC